MHYSHFAYYIDFGGDRVATPAPLIFTLSLPAITAAFDQRATPAPLIFTLSFPSVLVPFDQTATPDPLVFSLSLPSIFGVFDQRATAGAVVFTVSFPSLTLVPGPVTLTPDPLKFHLYLPPPGMGDFAPGAVLVPSKIIYVVTFFSSALGAYSAPAQAIQGTVKPEGEFDEWGVSIPGAGALLGSLTPYFADANALMIVHRKTVYQSGSALYESLFGLPIDSWERNRGPNKDVVTVRSRAASIYRAPSTRTLTSALQSNSISDGSASLRVPLDLSLVPGDLVTYTGSALVFTVGQVSYNLTPGRSYLTLSD